MTQTSLKCGCTINLVVHIINSILLLLVLVFQGSTLDFYLILHNEGTAGWYFWFLADFLVLVAFMAAGIVSYRFYKRKAKLLDVGHPEETDESLQTSSRAGLLPFGYIVWSLYALLLISKVILLFKLDVAQTLNWKNAFSPQLLKVVIAFSSIVFMLLLVMHHDAKKNTQHHSYITYLISSVSFEILDSVTFLGILFTTETKLVLPYSLENAILVLSCVNFLLPGLSLYILSHTNFGLNPSPTGLSILYNVLHLTLINLPYFIIRVHLWTTLDHDVSLFLLKNVLLILITTRNIIGDLRVCWRMWKETRHRFNRYTEQEVELGVICGQNEDTMIHMDEINLNEVKLMNKTHL